MKAYKVHKVPKKKPWKKIAVIVMSIAVILGVGTLLVVRNIYNENLRAVDSLSTKEVVVAIPVGSSLNQITLILKNSGVIRAQWAFKQYVLNEEFTDKLQAGTYRFKASQDVKSIVADLIAGKVAVDLFTILPGQRIDQIKQAFVNGGYSVASVRRRINPYRRRRSEKGF